MGIFDGLTKIGKAALSPIVDWEEENTQVSGGESGEPAVEIPSALRQMGANVGGQVPSAASSLSPQGATKQQTASAKIEKLAETLEAAQGPGFNYSKFRNSLNILKNSIFDEKARYQTAFAVTSAASGGGTKAELLGSIEGAFDIFQKEKTSFETAIRAKQQKDIESRRTTISNLENEINAASAKIQELTHHIDEKQKQKMILVGELSSQETKIRNNVEDFHGSLAAIQEAIKFDKERIDMYVS